MSRSAEAVDGPYWRGIALVTLSYLAALVVGIVAARLSPFTDGLALAAVADVAATLTVFAFSYRYGNSSFYDAYWSVIPPAIVGYWVLWFGEAGEPVRQALVLAAVAFWGTRLTANWARGWSGLHHEDWRYVDLRHQSGLLYWPVSLLGLHLFPTVLVFLGLLGPWIAVTTPAPLGALDAVGALVAFGAVLLEARADQELHAFRARRPPREAVIDEGLWRWTRHPNYLGELSFWVGMWLFAVAAAPTVLWPIAGPVAMALLFRFVSIPMMEQRMLRRRPETYRAYMQRTPMLLPWPPGRRPVPVATVEDDPEA